MVRIVSVQPLPGCRLKVVFDDGLAGVFAVEPERRGGVFLRLLEPRIFDAVTVNSDFGCVEWPGGIDLCPDTMHQAMSETQARAAHNSPMVLRDKPAKS